MMISLWDMAGTIKSVVNCKLGPKYKKKIYVHKSDALTSSFFWSFRIKYKAKFDENIKYSAIFPFQIRFEYILHANFIMFDIFNSRFCSKIASKGGIFIFFSVLVIETHIVSVSLGHFFSTYASIL